MVPLLTQVIDTVKDSGEREIGLRVMALSSGLKETTFPRHSQQNVILKSGYNIKILWVITYAYGI